MKYLLLILTALLLQSCETSENNNHGFGFDYSFITELGIKVRMDKSGRQFSSEEIDDHYILMSECAGFSPDSNKLMIIMTANQKDINRASGRADVLGAYLVKPSLIVSSNAHKHSERLVVETLRREMINHIFFRAKESFDITNEKPQNRSYENCTRM